MTSLFRSHGLFLPFLKRFPDIKIYRVKRRSQGCMTTCTVIRHRWMKSSCWREFSSNASEKESLDMSKFPVERIRNFSIIAHIDHGKSTLADRLLEITGAIAKTASNKQVLDKLQVERERGITVKAQTASLFYQHEGQTYLLNLIDTPGHVDFSYEVSRSISACQGVLLIVDANQSTFYIHPTARVDDLFKALVFDSTFDHYRGVVANIALFGGRVSRGDKIVSAHLGKSYEVNELGLLRPDEHPTETLYAGQVGYVIAGMKEVKEAQIGDTLYLHKQPVEALPGFKPAKSMVFAEVITIINPAQFPDKSQVVKYLEPMVMGTIIAPDDFTGRIMTLCQSRRAVQKNMFYIDDHRVMMKYIFPLNEIVVDFYDQLKSMSSGYASFDYEDAGYEAADLIKMDFLLNGRPVEELATIVHKQVNNAYSAGKAICERLKESIPRQMFEIAVQAAIGSKIIARETIKAYRKNVLAKCYGGDITRKMKLLKKQAEGKKKLRRIGNIDVPKDAFINVLKRK
ncbi:hypothetical protein cypCar_00023881 [Cyprinus carpio]|nr:hypothetical protein cypCar_00023881 [Cyprinus carpio]